MIFIFHISKLDTNYHGKSELREEENLEVSTGLEDMETPPGSLSQEGRQSRTLSICQ